MPRYSNAEIAADYRLWMTYADPGANDTEARFDAWSLEERLAILVEMFGHDPHNTTED